MESVFTDQVKRAFNQPAVGHKLTQHGINIVTYNHWHLYPLTPDNQVTIEELP